MEEELAFYGGKALPPEFPRPGLSQGPQGSRRKLYEISAGATARSPFLLGA